IPPGGDVSDGDFDEVTFDPVRVSATELKQWMKLSPFAEGEYLIPNDIDACDSEDLRYQGCGREPVVLNFHNAQLNLAKIRERIRELNTRHYPPELAPVIAYVKKIQSFALWENTQRLYFAEHFDASVLAAKYDGIDPKIKCGDVLKKIGTASDRVAASQLALSWRNCVWNANEKRIGAYPTRAWQAFLAAYGIRERYVPPLVDD
ncbi:MAG: hypothetical protein ACYC6M_08995, partial [Terriglobales bacterium]